MDATKIAQNLCDNLRFILNAHCYTPETLAEKTGLTLRDTRRLFKEGNTKIPGDVLIDVCMAIGVEPMRLLGGGAV